MDSPTDHHDEQARQALEKIERARQARRNKFYLREEHISRQGFFGPVAMIYREHGPNEIVRVEGTLSPRRVADRRRSNRDRPYRDCRSSCRT